MNKNILFFDIDGTIYSNKIGYVTNGIFNSIKVAQKNGNLCFINTGRPYKFIPKVLKDNIDGFVLGNGSQIKNKDFNLKTIL